MDIPLFGNRWNAPSHPRYYSPGVRSVPVQKQPVQSPAAVPRPSKVVSIPVHFVQQEPERDRPGSAVKIQKVFRGYLVRKSVRRIAALRKEVEEIERKVSDPETAAVMRRDPRERVRVNETLMNVLFRLDSVRGVDSGVRDCRKAVIKRAIALQEKVDGIADISSVVEPAADADRAAGMEEQAENGGGAMEEVSQVDDCGAGEPILGSLEDARMASDGPQEQEGTEAAIEQCGDDYQRIDESAGEGEQLDGSADGCDNQMIAERAGGEESEMCMCGNHEKVEENDQNDERLEENDKAKANENVEIGDGESPIPTRSECSVDTQTESQTDSSGNPASEEVAYPMGNDGVVKEEDEEEGELEGKKEGEDGERSRRNKALLERMMEDNAKMMGMMAELFQRNERQTRLLTLLSQRVEQLERAFVCEKLRRKKKRNAAGSSIGCSDTSPDPTRSWKK